MIGKISKGAGFKGCVNYVLGKPDARLLAAEGVLTDSIQSITDCFQAQRMMKPNIRQPVGHISLRCLSVWQRSICRKWESEIPSISSPGTMTKSIRTSISFSTGWTTTGAPSATGTTAIGMSRSARN